MIFIILFQLPSTFLNTQWSKKKCRRIAMRRFCHTQFSFKVSLGDELFKCGFLLWLRSAKLDKTKQYLKKSNKGGINTIYFMGLLFGLPRWPKLSDPMCVLAPAFSSGKEKSPVGGGSRGQLLDTSWLLT